nr:T-cell receptor homolog [Heterodontus francisci]
MFLHSPVQERSRYPVGNRLTVAEGKTVEMHCFQNDTSDSYMYWYRQQSGAGLLLIVTSIGTSDTSPEEGFKERFKVTRPDLKTCSLKILRVDQTDRAVYYCAASGHPSDSNSEAYFGDGTKLVVLGENDTIRPAKVTVFEPSPEEIREKKKATVVCLVSDFYPDNIKIHWLVDGKEKDANDTNIHTDLNAILSKENTSYSISSRLRFDALDWARSKNVECRVDLYTNESVPTTSSSTLAVKAEMCGISKEAKIQSMATAKLTYLILICKSIFYTIFISTIAWKTKTSYSKRFD